MCVCILSMVVLSHFVMGSEVKRKFLCKNHDEPSVFGNFQPIKYIKLRLFRKLSLERVPYHTVLVPFPKVLFMYVSYRYNCAIPFPHIYLRTYVRKVSSFVYFSTQKGCSFSTALLLAYTVCTIEHMFHQ